MLRTIALLGLLAVPAPADVSLKGTWKADFEQAWYCDKPAPVSSEHFTFDIEDAPYLNRTAPSFNFSDANVLGKVTLQVRAEHSHPETVISGLLVGAIVKGAAGPALKGYIISPAEYGSWIANKKQGVEPPDAGEVELEISGSSLQGYTLTGIVRSGEPCSNFSHLDSVVRDLTGHFGRGVPSKWSARVLLKKQ